MQEGTNLFSHTLFLEALALVYLCDLRVLYYMHEDRRPTIV